VIVGTTTPGAITLDGREPGRVLWFLDALKALPMATGADRTLDAPYFIL
jgi:hypothetical protein